MWTRLVKQEPGEVQINRKKKEYFQMIQLTNDSNILFFDLSQLSIFYSNITLTATESCLTACCICPRIQSRLLATSRLSAISTSPASKPIFKFSSSSIRNLQSANSSVNLTEDSPRSASSLARCSRVTFVNGSNLARISWPSRAISASLSTLFIQRTLIKKASSKIVFQNK